MFDNRKKPHTEPLINHKIECIPYHKIGVDLCEINNDTYLVTVDYYTEVTKLKTTSSSVVIDHLKENFARHRIPNIVVSDNGPQFISQVYREFASHYGFELIYSSPHFPKSNGQVKRFVDRR